MKKNIGRLACIFMMVLILGTTVWAADVDMIKKDRVFQVNSDVELHEEPDLTSAVTAALPNGTPVIVREDAKDEWCKVAYREQTGYVQTAFLSIVGSQTAPVDQTAQNEEMLSADGIVYETEAQSADEAALNSVLQPDNEIAGAANIDALDDEFEMVQEQNQLSYQEAETTKEQARSDRIWGIVIAALVIVIFAVGVITTLTGNKRKKRRQ